MSERTEEEAHEALRRCVARTLKRKVMLCVIRYVELDTGAASAVLNSPDLRACVLTVHDLRESVDKFDGTRRKEAYDTLKGAPRYQDLVAEIRVFLRLAKRRPTHGRRLPNEG